MFALAVYDTRKQKLLLGRDRFGIKPLFYAPGNSLFAFASEIRALLAMTKVDDRPDRQAVYDFAALHYIPSPATFYTGIRAVQPGEILEATRNGDEVSWRAQTYHRWTVAPDPSLSLETTVEQAEKLLGEAVRRQLESDVPIGYLLSGGIDSSLVSAVAQDAQSRGVQTFNVGFAEKIYDEGWAAEAVAKHIGSQHTSLNMNGVQGTWDQVCDLLRHAGQPFADTSLFAVNAVCRLMGQHVKVALSGDGGDEGFGGYDHFWQIARIAHLRIFPVPLWRGAALGLVPLAHLGLVPAHWPQRFRQLTRADDVSIIQNIFSWIREEEHNRLCIDAQKVLPLRRLFEPKWDHLISGAAPRIERLSALATETSVRLVLPNDYLFKVDTASMKESLELRVPMLDEDLFAFGLTLPHRLKVKGRIGKRVLRAIADRKLPQTVARKPKQGFAIPVDTWVDADFKDRFKESLLGSGSKLPEFFRSEIYKPLVEAFAEGRPCNGISRQGLYQRAIMFLSVQLAMERGGV
jgi:asparagine synthase (glutamine-hydrolysing)